MLPLLAVLVIAAADAPPSTGPSVPPVPGAPATAIEPPPPPERPAPTRFHRFRLSYGVGLAVPFGRTYTGGPALEDLVTPQLGAALEAAVRIGRHVELGVAFDGAFGGARDASSRLDPEGNRAAFSMMFLPTLLARVNFAPADRWNPWLAAGIAAELTDLEWGGAGGSWTYAGPCWRLWLGADRRLTHVIGLGGYLTFAAGEFSSETWDFPTGTGDREIASTAVHYWVGAGFRFTLWP